MPSVKRLRPFIIEFIFLLPLVFLANVIIDVGGSGMYVTNIECQDVPIISIFEFEQNGNTWVSTHEDPNIVIPYTSGNYIDLELRHITEGGQQGEVYFADDVGNFSEQAMLPYFFKNGHNYIAVQDYENINYLRLDITDQKDVQFEIKDIDQISPVYYGILSVNIFKVLFLTLTFVVIHYLLLKYYADADNRKIDLIFWVLLGASILFLFKDFLMLRDFYMYTDVGADTSSQYYPYYVNEAIKLREGTYAVWNWSYGLGTSVLNVMGWTMDPFAWISVGIGAILGPGFVRYLLVWMQITKIVVIYMVARKYFSYFLTDHLSMDLSAYLYALNGYVFLWGQHYFLGTASFFIILVLWAIENYLYKKCRGGRIVLAVSIAWVLIFSYYIAYMIIIVCAIYFLFRYFSEARASADISRKAADVAKTVFLVLCGGLISCTIMLPAINYVSSVPSRLDGAKQSILPRLVASFTSSFMYESISTKLGRLISNNTLYGVNYYEAPILFCSVLFFFFAAQWLIYEINKSRQQKSIPGMIIKLLLMFIFIFTDVAGYILNGFVYVAFRYTFTVMPFFALMIGIVVQEVLLKRSISVAGIGLGAIMSAIAIWCSYRICATYMKIYVDGLLFLMFIGAILFMAFVKKSIPVGPIVTTLILFIICSTTFDNWFTTNIRICVPNQKDSSEWTGGELSSSTSQAIKWLKETDTSFYRVVKTYSDFNEWADSFIENYSTVSCYNSTLNSRLEEYYTNIYENSNIWPKVMRNFALASELDKVSLNLVNTKYLLSRGEISYAGWTEINRFGDTVIYQNDSTDSIAKWYTKTITKSEFETLSQEEKAAVLEDTAVMDENMTFENNNDTHFGTFILERQTYLKGSVSNSGRGILMIGTPYEDGWDLYVDGKKSDMLECNYGFIGTVLENGEHIIELKYHVPYAKEGLILSISGVLLLLAFVLFSNRRAVTSTSGDDA